MEVTILIFIFSIFILGFSFLYIAPYLGVASEKTREIQKLTTAQIIIVGCVAIPSYLGGYIYYGILAIFLIRAVVELYSIKSHNQKIRWQDNKLRFSIVLSGILLTILIVQQIPFPLHLVLCAGFATILSMTWIENKLHTFLGLFTLGLTVSSFMYLEKETNSFLLIAFIYLLTETFDSFAFIVGKIWGKRKILPNLSPKKTIEGIVGGSIVAICAGIGFQYFILQWQWANFITATIIILIAGFIGDLITSAFKRSMQVKDFPTIHETHGGIIDIYDALSFAIIGFSIYHMIFVT